MPESRRSFIKTAAMGGMGSSLLTAFSPKKPNATPKINPEPAPTPILDPDKMAPDFRATLGTYTVGVDIDLLGPKGEITLAFVLSLDPHHGEQWKKLPRERLADQSFFRIHEMLTHMEKHGIQYRDVEKIYNAAFQQWKKKYAGYTQTHEPQGP